MRTRYRVPLGALLAAILLLVFVVPGNGQSPGASHPRPTTEQPASGDARTAPRALPGHVFFNDPLGGTRAKFALVRHINEAIRRSPRGSTIRVAEYSFAMPSTAAALVNAHRRGVMVQVIVDDHATRWRSVRELARALGMHKHANSFVKVCHRSCRGGPGNQHAKFVTFSRTGRKQDLVMIGSVNFTRFNAMEQWNDLYTVADPRLYTQVRGWFRLMKKDRPQAQLKFPGAGEGMRMVISPLVDPSKRDDPVYQRLQAVRCRGARHAGDPQHRTIIRIAMHAWNGSRGVLLARQMAGLHELGCNVKVLYGIGIGRQVLSILTKAGVPVRNSEDRGRRVHEKVMILSGVLGKDRSAKFVWTGSHNWSNRSLVNDEVILRVEGARLVGGYLHNFHTMWSLVAPRRAGG